MGVLSITVDIRFQDYALKKCVNLLIKSLRFIDSHVLDKCISRGWRWRSAAGFVPRLNWTAPPRDLHTLMKLTLPLAGKPTQMWDAKKIENTPTLTPPQHLPHHTHYPRVILCQSLWPLPSLYKTLQTYIFKHLVNVSENLQKLFGKTRRFTTISIPVAFLNKSGKFNLMIESLNF